MSTRPLFCPECGLIELPAGTDRCPECGLTALDDADPANRDAIAEAIGLRRNIMQPRWALASLIGVFAATMVGGMVLLDDPNGGQLLAYLVTVAWWLVISQITKRRLTPAWRAALAHVDAASGDAALRHRVRTGVTVIVAVLLVGVFAIQLAVGTDHMTYERGDAPWRIATASLAHGGPFHLLGNLLGLLVFGTAIDLRVGRLATAGIMAFAAVTAAIAQSLYEPGPMLGFSGAILGLAGATVALMPTRPALLTIQGVSIPLPTAVWSIFWLGLITLAAWADTRHNVAWVAHLGGFVGGFLVAIPMRRLRPTAYFARYEQQRRERIEKLASR